MSYIDRDAAGNIRGIYAVQQRGGQEYLEGAELYVPPPTYQQLRAAAYPPVTDYLDAVVKGDQEQMQAYIDACLAVKTKYPK